MKIVDGYKLMYNVKKERHPSKRSIEGISRLPPSRRVVLILDTKKKPLLKDTLNNGRGENSTIVEGVVAERKNRYIRNLILIGNY